MPNRDLPTEKMPPSDQQAIARQQELEQERLQSNELKREGLWRKVVPMSKIMKMNDVDYINLIDKALEAGVDEAGPMEKPYPYVALKQGVSICIRPDPRVDEGEVLFGEPAELEKILCAR